MEHRTRLQKRLMFVLGSILIIGVESVETARAQWVKNVYTTSGWSDDHLVNTETKYESAYALAYPGSSYSICSADAAIESTDDDSAYANAWAYAVTIYIWGWSGPPGTSPYVFMEYGQDSDGGAEANGQNTLSEWGSGSAISISSASSWCSVDNYTDDIWARGEAWGNATVGESTTGDEVAQADPPANLDILSEIKELYPLRYLCLVDWQYYDDGVTYIPGGSPYIMFVAQLQCSARAEGDAWPRDYGTRANANSTSNASMSFYANLVP